MSRAAQCLTEISDLKRSSSSAHLVRLFHEVWKQEHWRRRGFRSFKDWAKNTLGIGRAWIYRYVKIGEFLPSLSDEQIDQLGLTKCTELSRLAEAGKTIDSHWLDTAKRMPITKLKVAVDCELLRDHRPQEFGELLDPSFRGLQHAPTNEQGVVYLFGMVSQELGFIVEKVQQTYPDCIAKQRVNKKPEKWRQVRIEFEYKSSNFDHPPQGSDLIVCWEDDLAHSRRKAPLPVLELKSAIGKLVSR